MASLTIERIEKSFGAEPVLRNISLAVSDGEFLVLVGPSGCGKSTLLRLVAGLEEMQDGSIALAGNLIADVRPQDRDIAMVFQNYALYPHMTVRDNMAFSLRLRGVSKADRAAAARKAAEILGLESYLDRYPRQLSGGQRQRVAMGRAIVRNPRLFLFDEPLSNLDAQLRVQMRTEIKELHRRLGATSIYVTHDQIEAMTLADRIAIMNKGRIEQIGAPLDLYDRPRNLFVASFIGSPMMNLLDVTVNSANGPAYAKTPDGNSLPLPAGRAYEHGRPLVYGIRPEHVNVEGQGLPAEVVVVEPTGPETLVHVRAGVSDWTVMLRERRTVRLSDRLFLSPDLNHVHLFDRRTGERLSADSI
jgi:multiple sugar transport system ATP-binding protein